MKPTKPKRQLKMTKIAAARASHEAMKTAVTDFLEWSAKYRVDAHIFPSSFRSKIPIWLTNGSLDAVSSTCHNPEHRGRGNNPATPKVDCPRDPLTFWNRRDSNFIGANPCIRLDHSGLTAIDIDSGVGGKSNDELKAIFEECNLPPTQVFKTGRRSGGLTLIYRGVRDADHPDGPFSFGPLKGDVKCHGHIVIPGGLHLAAEFQDASEELKRRETRIYRKVNDWYLHLHPPLAPLPEYWMNWKHKTEEKPQEITKRTLEYRKYLDREIAAGRKSIVPAGERIPRGKRFAYLKKMAGRARLILHFGPEKMREYLEELAILECEGGIDYANQDALKIDWLAGVSQTWNRGDFVTEGQVVIDDRVSRIRTRGKTREEVMRDVISQFPDRIECRDAITRVRAEFDRFNKNYGTNWKLVERGRSIETYYAALADAGFPKALLDRTGGGCWRVKEPGRVSGSGWDKRRERKTM